MARYDYDCGHCGNRFEAKVPIDQRDDVRDCLVCGENAAHRRFSPQAIMIQVPAHLAYTRFDFQCPSTPQHTSDYIHAQQTDDHLKRLHEADEQRKPVKTVKDRLLEKYPDTRIDEPLTRADTQELKELLAAGPPKD